MAATPTLQELYEGVLADLEAELNINIPIVGKLFTRALASVQAAKLKLYYLSIADVERNIFVDTATPESQGGTLERFGRGKLGRSPFPAVQGRYNVIASGTPGATITIGNLFKSDDNALNAGRVFQNDSEAIIEPGGTVTFEVRALEGGVDSKLGIGDTITSSSPLINITDQVVVDAETTAPQNRETNNDYRTDILNSWRLEPQGGAPADYRIWSGDAQGSRRVYPYVRSGGVLDIDVYVEAQPEDSTDGKGTPTQQVLDNVEAVINFDPDTTVPTDERGRLPMNVNLTVLPISVQDVDIEIVNAQGFTADEQTLIEQELEQFINAIRPFISGADIVSERNDVLSKNAVIGVITSVVGNNKTFDDVTLRVAGNLVPVSLAFIDGDIPALNSVTYV